MNLLIIAQDTTAASTKSYISVYDLLLMGGPIIIPIIVLSIISTYIFIERYNYIKKIILTKESETNKHVSEFLYSGDSERALKYCLTLGSSYSLLLSKLFMRLGSSSLDLEHALHNLINIEIAKMEKNLSILSAIASIAPMLGFLGTVMGMITTFHDISNAGEINISVISTGIYQKMITSMAGLIVGILAYVYFTILNSMIDKRAIEYEIYGNMFIESLLKPINMK